MLHRADLLLSRGIPAGRPAVPPRSTAKKTHLVAQARRARRDYVADSDDEVTSDPKKKAARLDSLIAHINSVHGKGTLIKLGTKVDDPTMQFFPSGCLGLDAALNGGYPVGRIIEIYGPESSGKTTLALHAIAEVQKRGGAACFIDAEHAFDKAYAKNLGVDVDEMLMLQPESGEQALEIADSLGRSGEIELVVIDSVSALTPRAELEGEVGTMQMGGQARLMSNALRKLCSTATKNGTTFIFLNQLRYKIGVVFGNPETTSGGSALKYYCSVRIDVRKKETIKGENDEIKGIKTRAKVVKNKVGPPYREALFDILFGCGIDSIGSLFDGAEMCGVIKRKGSYYYFGEEKIGQGREKVISLIRESQEMRQKIEEAVRGQLQETDVAATSTDDDGLDGDELPIEDDGFAES